MVLDGTSQIRSHEIPSYLMAEPQVNMNNVDFSSMGISYRRNDVLYSGDVVECKVTTGASHEPEVWTTRITQAGAIDVPYVGALSIANNSLESAEALIRRVCVEQGVYRNPIVSIRIAERQTNQIEIVGAVSKPGVYKLPTVASNLVAALSIAGGLLPEAMESVEVHDPLSGSGPQSVNVAELSANKTGNFYLNDGAVVHVGQDKKRYVHVLGNARTNRSVELSREHPMRLLDALAEVGGLRYSNWICDSVEVTRSTAQSSEETQVIRLSIKKARRDTKENILLADGDIIHVDENPLTFTLNTLQGLMGVGVSAGNIMR